MSSTTTDPARQRAERLEQLRQRSARTSPRRSFLRSPAVAAKIVTAGASTTAVLGMMAGFGIAERQTASADEAVGSATQQQMPSSDEATDAVVDAVLPPLESTVATAPPSGPMPTTPGAGAAVAVAAADPAGTPAPTAQPTTAAPIATTPIAAPPQPVAAPVAVDLAVPPPPPPSPKPAAQQSSSQPAPQATSSGS
jgi:hypothetical protein